MASVATNNTAPDRELVVKVRDIMVKNGWLFCVQVFQKDKDGSSSYNNNNNNKNNKKKKAKKRRVLISPPSKVLEFYFPRTTESAKLNILEHSDAPFTMDELKQVEAPTVSGLKLHIHRHLKIPPGEQRLFLCSNSHNDNSNNNNNVANLDRDTLYSRFLLGDPRSYGLDSLFAVNRKDSNSNSNSNNNVTNDDRQPLYYGYLLDPYLERDVKAAAAKSGSDMEDGTRELAEPAPNTYTMKVLLEHVPLDQKVRQLFQLSQLAYWKKRDKIMQTMVHNREETNCFCGCSLVVAMEFFPLVQEDDGRTFVGHCTACCTSLVNFSQAFNNQTGDTFVGGICPNCPLEFTTMMCRDCLEDDEYGTEWRDELSCVINVYNRRIMPTDLHEILLMICLYLQKQRLEIIILHLSEEDERESWDDRFREILEKCDWPYLLKKVVEGVYRFEPDKDLVLLPHFHESIRVKFCDADRKELEKSGLQDKIAEAESLILRPWKDVDKTSSGTGQSHMALLRDFLETWTSRPVFAENLWPALENRSPAPFFFVKAYDMDEIVIGVSKKHGEAD